MRNRLLRTLLIVVLAIAIIVVPALLVGFNAFRGHMIAKAIAGMRPPAVPVEVATATLEDIPRDLVGIGSLLAVRQVTVSPEISARVVQIFFQPGAEVHAGDKLVQLNDAPNQGDLANFQAQAHIAALNLDRAQRLVGKQFETQVTVDTDKAQLEEAQAQIAKTQAQIAQLLVRAPFDGALGIRQIDLGQYLSAGTAIITLTDLSQLYVNFTLPEQERGQLKLGQPVAITVDAYPGRRFPATLTTIEPQISADTRTIMVQATLGNPGHLLLPGMFANASVSLPPQRDVVVLPETAVDYSLYGDDVFILHKQNDGSYKVTRTYVKTGRRFDGKVAVLEGVRSGDVAAASGQLKLTNDALVTPTDAKFLKAPATMPLN
jgi:multidrug efflux system membrane fusion protein